MEGLTLGVIAKNIAFLAAFIGTSLALIHYLGKAIDKVVAQPLLKKMDENKNVLEKEIKEVKDELSVVGADQCKNYLVRFLADVEVGENLSEAEVERAYDAYEKYTKSYHGNSYIHDRWDKLMRKRGGRNE